MAVRVQSVVAGSVAHAVGIVRDTMLCAINGRAVTDFLDWEFLSADDSFMVDAEQPDGRAVQYTVTRVPGESLGIELEPPKVRQCANRCEFCFIEGLPEGLRKPLYLRDDDYRLSFTYGNFATLSNVRERDIARILEYRLSPLYVSVHATPHDVRKRLLNNPKVPNIVEQLTQLAEGGIQFHGQMVIVPGENDGAVLEQSLTDLWDLGDAVMSVAIVPVGLTQFSHLYTGRSMDRPTARGILDQVSAWTRRARRERGTRWVYGSDELYLLAEVELPAASYYGDFPQIENGVGAVALLRQRVTSGVRKRLPSRAGEKVGVVTGMSMAPLMPPLLEQLASATGAEFELIPMVNSLFGPTTTTAGLLTSADMRAALMTRTDLDWALIPAESINESGIFLDDVSFDALRKALPIPVFPSYDFLDVLRIPLAKAA